MLIHWKLHVPQRDVDFSSLWHRKDWSRRREEVQTLKKGAPAAVIIVIVRPAAATYYYSICSRGCLSF